MPTVKGYRAALNHVFTLAGTDLAANGVIGSTLILWVVIKMRCSSVLSEP